MRQNATIWLVDDDEHVVDIVSRAFKLENLTCEVICFPNSKTLLDEIAKNSTLPSVLVIDYYLPDEDGLRLIERLRNNPTTQSLRTVLFSQQLKTEVVLKAEALDVYQVAPKPASFQEWRLFADELCLAGYFSR
jgi:two-component system alkaline phosphatase synthesis response regulator PhoP